MNDGVLIHNVISGGDLLADGTAGIDAGLTLTKIAYRHGPVVELTARASDGTMALVPGARVAGITGARADASYAPGARSVPEIEAAARGVVALMPDGPREFILALLGTGTAFAVVRDGAVTHLGGTAMGGGSFFALARRAAPSSSYAEVIAAAGRGDRRNADLLVSDAYADGIGRIGGEMTAAHLAKGGGSVDDFLAALLNMHGENIGQIAAGRALAAGVRRIVIAGGFAHGSHSLTGSMAAMTRLFGVPAEVSPHPGFAGAIGAALCAAARQEHQP